MIDCEECHNYAKKIYERGEISAAEINKLALDRHILKGCDYLNGLNLISSKFVTVLPSIAELGVTITLKPCSKERGEIRIPEKVTVILKDGITKCEGKWILISESEHETTYRMISNDKQ